MQLPPSNVAKLVAWPYVEWTCRIISRLLCVACRTITNIFLYDRFSASFVAVVFTAVKTNKKNREQSLSSHVQHKWENTYREASHKREGFRLISVLYVLEVKLLMNQAVHATNHFYLVRFCSFKYTNYKLNDLATFRKKNGRLRNEVQICEVCSNNFHVYGKQEYIRRNLSRLGNLSAYLRTL